MSGVSMATQIALLHASIEVHAEDRFSKFHSIMFRAHGLLWSLPPVDP